MQVSFCNRTQWIPLVGEKLRHTAWRQRSKERGVCLDNTAETPQSHASGKESWGFSVESYVYMRVCIYVHAFMYKHAHICIHMHIHLCIHIYTYMYILNMNIYVCIYEKLVIYRERSKLS